MKAARIIFIILGWFFIFLQVISYIGALQEKGPIFSRTEIAYLIARNFLLLLGVLFLFLARRKKTQIKERSGTRELESLFIERKD
jgi:hypothetical protein